MTITSVAIQFTIIDLLSRGVDAIKGRMKSLATANKDVQQSFDRMAQAGKIAAGSLVATSAMASALQPAVMSAASLQEAMLKVKAQLAGSASDAKDLNKQLATVKSTAIEVSANAPFSAEDVVGIQNSLLKAGLKLQDVAGKSGAAFAATILASLSGMAPEEVGNALANLGTQFKLSGGDYGKLADWLVRVDDAAATSVPMLVEGLKMSGSNAAALKISVQDSVTSLGALSALGERAGSSFNNFLIGVLGMSSEQRKYMKHYKIDLFENGRFIGMDQATDQLRERFGNIKDDQKRLLALMKIFGEEGGRAANEFIGASKGFKEIRKDAESSLSAAQKMAIWAEGFNASLKKLAGTAKSAMAELFQPALAPLTAITDKVNELSAALGGMAQEHEGISKAASWGSLGAVGAGTLAAAGAGAAALYYGRKTVKGLGGFGKMFGGAASAAAGIATGKAVEAATGVQPVFVTNWPAGGLGGSAADIAAGAAGGNLFKKLLPALGLAGKFGAYGAGGFLAGKYIFNPLLGKASEKISGGKYGGEGWLGEMLYDVIHGREVKNEIQLNVAIDERGRVTTKSNDMNTKANVKPLKRGEFGPWQTASAH